MIPDADSIKLIDTIVEEVAYGSALNDSQFACRFLTLTKQRSYENMCLIKPLFKLVVEGKQNKQLIDRSKPDDDLSNSFFFKITILIYTAAF